MDKEGDKIWVYGRVLPAERPEADYGNKELHEDIEAILNAYYRYCTENTIRVLVQSLTYRSDSSIDEEMCVIDLQGQIINDTYEAADLEFWLDAIYGFDQTPPERHERLEEYYETCDAADFNPYFPGYTQWRERDE